MDEDQIDGCVSGYLKKKGFTQNDQALRQHTHTNNDSSLLQSLIVTRTQLESGPARYYDGYGRLRSWAYRSLDSYKHELLRVLYPVFIHCFMDLVAKGHLHEARSFFNTFREDHETMHLQDLQKLEGVLSPHHPEEMVFAHSLRQSKFKIKICGYSYELLLQHLHSTQSTTIIGIINEHISFQVTTGQPSSISDDPEAVTLTGSIQDKANHINQKEILLGLLEDSLEEHTEKAGALLSNTEKGEGEAKEGENDESKKRSIDGGKHGGSLKKVKKDKSGSAIGKSAKPEANTVSTAPHVKAELPLPIVSTDVELSILEDLRNRVQLNSVALPSVNFYTFINTQNGFGIWQSLDNGPPVLFHTEGMTHHKMNKCWGKMAGKHSTRCFKVIWGQSMQLVSVQLGILFFPLQQTKQFNYGVESLMPILFVTRVTITLSGMFSLVLQATILPALHMTERLGFGPWTEYSL